MTLAEAQTIIHDLSTHFCVPEPNIVLKSRGYKSKYNILTETIRLARPNLLFRYYTQEQALLHEFAHHLDWMPYRTNNAFRTKGGHGRSFWYNLWDITNFYYHYDPGKYCWELEYSSGKRFARQKGINRNDNGGFSVLVTKNNDETSRMVLFSR